MTLSDRLVYAGFVGTMLVGMAFALYLQHVEFLDPCPLCVFQRVALIAVGVVAALAWLHNPAGTMRGVYAGLLALAALAGVVVAGRHVWLQNLPPEAVPACGPGLSYWLDTLPFTQVLNQVFKGSGECAAIDWTLLGFSLPELTLALFAALFVGAVWQGLRRIR